MIPMSISNTNHSRLASTHSSLPNTRTSLQFCPLKQLRFRRFLSLPLLLIVLLLAACGPETSASKNEDLVASTKQIALTYQASNDLAQAQTALNAVDVANPLQWLVYVTESVLSENSDQDAMMALVHLATDMGLQSEPISRFATQHNLVESVNTANAALAPSAQVASTITESQTALNSQPVAPSNPLTSETSIAVNQVAAVSVTTSTLSADPASTLSNTATISTAVTTTAAALIITPTVVAELPSTEPMAKAIDLANVRSGPGTNYDVVGGLETGIVAPIIGKNETGDWWQVTLATGQQGWVYGPLVEASGDTTTVALATDIAPPPPTATPEPVVEAPTPAPTEVVAPTSVVAEGEPTSVPAPATSGNDFLVIEKHLWDVVENGGQLNGPSVTCGQGRELRVRVLDANGGLLNGVAVQAIYGAQEVYVTGAQGKGDGMTEFVLGGGQAVKIIRDADGREVTSDEVYNLSTKPWEISYEDLIAGNYCTDDASCKSFVDQTGCYGHYSWTVTFKRRY